MLHRQGGIHDSKGLKIYQHSVGLLHKILFTGWVEPGERGCSARQAFRENSGNGWCPYWSPEIDRPAHRPGRGDHKPGNGERRLAESCSAVGGALSRKSLADEEGSAEVRGGIGLCSAPVGPSRYCRALVAGLLYEALDPVGLLHEAQGSHRRAIKRWPIWEPGASLSWPPRREAGPSVLCVDIVRVCARGFAEKGSQANRKRRGKKG